jgi:hypothetical protein
LLKDSLFVSGHRFDAATRSGKGKVWEGHDFKSCRKRRNVTAASAAEGGVSNDIAELTPSSVLKEQSFQAGCEVMQHQLRQLQFPE